MHNEKQRASNDMSFPTRRQVLKTVGTGAAIIAGTGLISSKDRSVAASSMPSTTAAIVPTFLLKPFALSDVRVLGGPFLEAQKRDEAYILKLEPDRLLHNFRVNAGLQPKARIYGGWESEKKWEDIRCHGHTLGHYLTAASLMYASTGKEEFKNRVTYIVSELKECQDAGGTGLICAFPDNATQIDNLVAGHHAVGVPWYTLHKVFAGLRDAYLYCGNSSARDVLVKLTEWAVQITGGMTDDQFEEMLGVEHGGMNEVVADVYALTRDPKYLALAERFCHKAILTPLSERRDKLDGLHSNTQIPKIVGFERLYQLTGKIQYHNAATFFWETVTGSRSFATGGNGDNEHFFPVRDFGRHIQSAKTMETCCSHNMLRLTRSLFCDQPSALLADYYEKTLFNAILASQDPDSGMMTYFQSLRPGYVKLYCTPFDSFWCCTGTGMENHAKYGDSIYYSGDPDGPLKDVLYISLFIASELNWKAQHLILRQTTSFPDTGTTRLEITAATPVEVTLKVRHPGWAATAAVKINGVAGGTSAQPGSYIELNRIWKSGDVVELNMPMALRLESLPGDEDTVAVACGPIVLVAALGHQVKPGDDLHADERTIGSVLNDHIEVPTFVGPSSDIPSKIIPGDSPLTFTTKGLGHPDDVTLVPYYRIAHQHFNMYWKVQNA